MTRETTEERTRKRWKQALDLFEQSLALAPTEREQLLKSAGEQDPLLRQTLGELLTASRDAEAGGFLESPAWTYQPIESNPQALVGRRIGAYRLTQYLAKGGMGVVYLAERADKFFRRQVAIKFINAEAGPKHYARFRREVQILADLKHPNLVILYDAGRLGDGRSYIVMEYVEGENLRDWSQRHGPMPPAKVAEIIKQACAGLHAAHEAGIIHRDIKPANIVLTEDHGKLTVKVLDFGVAARKQHDGSGVNTTRGAIGTPVYMSPEQLLPTKGKDLTPASDVYALGLTAYELLTGTPANNGLSQGEIVSKHLYEMPEPPSGRRPDLDIPPSFDRVILKALAKNPAERHQSAPELASALEAIYAQKTLLWEGNSKYSRPQMQPPNPAGVQPPTPRPIPPQPAPQPNPLNQHQQLNPLSPRKYAKPVFAAAALLVVAAALLVVPRLMNQSSGKSQQQGQTTTQSPIQSANQPRALKLLVEVRNEDEVPLPSASIAIFKPGIRTAPGRIDESNAIILRTNAQGLAEAPSTDVTEGVRLVKVTHVGYQSRTEEFTLAEDKTSPGTINLTLKLKAE